MILIVWKADQLIMLISPKTILLLFHSIFIPIIADLEAVLADVSYSMTMEKSKSTPVASASRIIVLPDRT